MADDTRDPMERLAAADPATGAREPDLAAIQARAAAGSQVVPLRRRSRTPVVIGSIAAGVAILAGTAFAGVAVGRLSAPESPIVAAAPVQDSLPVVGGASPPLPTVAGQSMMPGSMPAGAETNAMSSPAGSAMSADRSMIYPGFGTSLVPAPDLVDEAGTAVGYRLNSTDVDPQVLATQLAVTFDVTGQPQKQDYGWSVGAPDGTGPSIWVGEDPTVSWSYSDPTQDPWACAGASIEPAPGDASTGGGAEPGAAESCAPQAEPISDRDAVRTARKLLASIGVTDDPAGGIDIEWEAGSDDFTTWVTAWQRVEGQRTQLAWSFTFAGDQVAWANGFAAGLEPVPVYPIVGAATAVERSSDPRFASFGPTPLDGGIVVPLAEDADASVSSSPNATADVPAGNPERVQVWWDPATVTGAELTLAQYWQPDGTLLILPAYRLTTADDRGTWAIIAVAESAMEFVAQPR